MKTTWELKSNKEINQIRKRAEKQLPIVTDNEELEYTASFFKVFADETRLKIISLLWIDDMCMCEIVEALNGANSTISHHLKIMEKVKVIISNREGKFTIYSINKEKISPLISYLKQSDKALY
ncbi:ArsR family transcriptional regulator [Bacillus coahuilensis m2-6]|uniref:ArsR/SmtB family transcription factor n=1 Tax=Bacillus coahuilensis TaxID=408580 RepID=UPI0007500E79|nr:metalloregulator ArsR/SmtB family transcription factor [Bacillus coahuilensis]KUP09740.1 ArsR family transcriptional regulator [Bacillus coahuilensis m2-6]